MSQHVVDTQVKLAKCNRCGSYVWLGMASGVRAAADVGAATHPAWIAAVSTGRRTFRLAKRAGKPSRLLCESLGGKPPSFTPEGVQDVTGGRDEVVVEHGCGAAARDMLTFEEVQQGPPQARATPGSSRAGGSLQSAALASKLSVEAVPRPGRPSPVRNVSQPRSSDLAMMQAVRCDTCDKIIDQSKPFFGVHFGRWVWAAHDEGDCP